jgi:3-oxoadipate enol-lactonase
VTPDTVLVPGRPRIAVALAGRGPLVLFLHGIGGNRNHWQHQLAFFSRQGFRAAAWDARGYGDSDDYEGALRFDDFSDDLARVLDFLGEARAHLVGLSMGGRIARNFALKEPRRVHSLTLANTSPGFDALSPEEVVRFVEERRQRSPDSTARLLGSRARTGAHEALLASFHALRNDSYLKTLEASVAQDRAAPLENLVVPTLVITGDEDRVYPLDFTERMARRIPGARLVVIEACGHLSNLEQPERFNAVLLDFLRGLEPAARSSTPSSRSS